MMPLPTYLYPRHETESRVPPETRRALRWEGVAGALPSPPSLAERLSARAARFFARPTAPPREAAPAAPAAPRAVPSVLPLVPPAVRPATLAAPARQMLGQVTPPRHGEERLPPVVRVHAPAVAPMAAGLSPVEPPDGLPDPPGVDMDAHLPRV